MLYCTMLYYDITLHSVVSVHKGLARLSGPKMVEGFSVEGLGLELLCGLQLRSRFSAEK